MTYFADPQKDLPAPWKPKRVIVYAQGLKIYGQIPYVLQRRLEAQFVSNCFTLLGAQAITPTAEDNYTIVFWRRKDGRPHSEAALNALLDWLFADSGFEAAVAAPENFHDRLDLPNAWQCPPRVFVPSLENVRKFFRLALADGFKREQIAELIEVSDAGGA